jgi:hypothetical protein
MTVRSTLGHGAAAAAALVLALSAPAYAAKPTPAKPQPPIAKPQHSEVGTLANTCGVKYSRLWCWNDAPTSVRSSPYTTDSWQVDTLRTTYSWFYCWTFSEYHHSGNRTWYGAVGDDRGAAGFVPASAVHTSLDFDMNPGAYGLPHC